MRISQLHAKSIPPPKEEIAMTHSCNAEGPQLHNEGRFKPVRHLAGHASKENTSLPKLLIPFSIHAAMVLVGFVLYLRLHRLDPISLFDANHSASLTRFDFVSTDPAIGGIIEILFWSFIATTLRWMRIGIIASRHDDFQLTRHFVEWGADLLTTPVVAAVIVYALRTWHLTSGQTINLSLEDANIGWFIVIGFLLGFFDQAPRLILNRLRKQTFGLQKDTRKPRSEKNRHTRRSGKKAGTPPRIETTTHRATSSGSTS